MRITSAAGVIALLDEPEDDLKVYALNRLNNIVPQFWPEISDHVEKIEVLYEDESFQHRKLSALLASKLYYYLGSFEDSLHYALCAGDCFNINENSEYVGTTISKCIDHYTKLRQQAEDCIAGGDEMKPDIDTRLEAIVNRMFEKCLADGQFKQAVGIAIEARRMDVFEQAVKLAPNLNDMLAYCLKLCTQVIEHKGLREKIFRLLVRLYSRLDSDSGKIEKPDYISVCQVLIYLDDASAVSEILRKLLSESQDQVTLAYQIGFDLYESASQHFLSDVVQALKSGLPGGIQVSVKEEQIKSEPSTPDDATVPKTEQEESTGATAASDETEEDRTLRERIETLSSILDGEKSIELNLQFLIRNNHSDLQILKLTKDQVRNSVCHNSTVIANSFMHCGTTSDKFLRDNLDWLSRATNWAKFTVTASLGVIHKGHEKDSLNLMSTYLPKDSSSNSAYQEGGGLYALGLIHANHGKGKITEYLLNQLKSATSEIVRHGGCLGLGLAAMGTAKHDVYELLKDQLYQDDAITGEAAGLAMGLVMLGSKSDQAIEDMVSYAQETQHEKIIRGLAVGIALVMYGRMEEADSLIQTLKRDKDPILRRSAMYTVAMAYAGSGSNKAIQTLLHVAVSDVNNDVRRAAVESLGFLMFRTPDQCPSVVSLLAESYNPHVRYGAAMALGIACAASGSKDALSLLEPLTIDSINYVRQGALIASAMILIQHTEATCSKVKSYRELYRKVISDKHEDVIAKYGAIIAQGILDAGGRNLTLSLQSRTGHVNMSSVVGMLVFCQFWFWFPLSHFLSLTFTPSSIVALNADLKMPKLKLISHAKPSVYAYPAPLEEKKGREVEKVAAAVLSITARSKAKEKRKRGSSSSATASVSTTPAPPLTPLVSAASSTNLKEEKMDVDDEKKDEKTEKEKDKGEKKEKTAKEGDEKEKKEPEPDFETLSNPCRAVPQQLKVISLPENSRYEPLKPLTHGGIIILNDKKKDEPEELVEPVIAGGAKKEEEDEGDEPEPPEPFEYTE
uniref:26S proteasome non-ATPase regulatory subunit 1-like n=1 Tax=Styela clava TaxID=7725 RepID=UPI00193A0760|nr:26S proteasome non-ATPase regulatory subunit 1-like [Styela clava]